MPLSLIRSLFRFVTLLFPILLLALSLAASGCPSSEGDDDDDGRPRPGRDDDDSSPGDDDDDSTPPPGDDDDGDDDDDDDSTPPPGDDDDDDDDPPWFEVCNYLDGNEGIYEIWSLAPGEDDWYQEFDDLLDWGDCYYSGDLWAGFWEVIAYDWDDYSYCASFDLDDGDWGTWDVTYDWFCE